MKVTVSKKKQFSMKLGVQKMACSSLYSILVSENQQENGHRLKVYRCMHPGRQSLKISYSITPLCGADLKREVILYGSGRSILKKSNEWNFILT